MRVNKIDVRLQCYALAALAAAALFGASAPFAKLLLGEISPIVLAGLLYLGSGIGLGLVLLAGRLMRGAGKGTAAARLCRQDLPSLAGAIVAGGVAAPVALLWGLSGTPASSASLLLNFESVLTVLFAAVVFREHVGWRVGSAALVMLGGAWLLAYDPQSSAAVSPWALAIVAACGLWALDNNLTRRVAGADAVQIAAIKGLVAGSVNFALGLMAGAAIPAVGVAGGALALGFAAYGVSLVLFILALRHLGSARTASHFGTAPYFGAALAIPLLAEPVTPILILATSLMAIATWLVLTEAHAHEHTHEAVAHAHRHVHDEHHRHSHSDNEATAPHSHEHTHEPLTHRHSHLPDLHHRHRH